MITPTDVRRNAALRERSPTTKGVIVAALMAPAVWMLHLLLSYLLVSIACQARWFGPRIAGLSVAEGVLVLLTAAAALTVILGGLRGYRIWRRSDAGIEAKGGTEDDREGFMGLAGAVLSVLFFFGLLLAGAPPFFLLLRSCGA